MDWNPREALWVAIAWPDFSVDWRVHTFLTDLGVPLANQVCVCLSPFTRAYNWAIANLVLKHSHPWAAFIERDMRPSGIVRPWIEAEGDVVGCFYPTACAASWASEHAIHSGLWRARRAVFERLKPPWFEWQFSANGADVRSCACLRFARRCVEAGFVVKRAGWCDHPVRERRRAALRFEG